MNHENRYFVAEQTSQTNDCCSRTIYSPQQDQNHLKFLWELIGTSAIVIIRIDSGTVSLETRESPLQIAIRKTDIKFLERKPRRLK